MTVCGAFGQKSTESHHMESPGGASRQADGTLALLSTLVAARSTITLQRRLPHEAQGRFWISAEAYHCFSGCLAASSGDAMDQVYIPDVP